MTRTILCLLIIIAMLIGMSAVSALADEEETKKADQTVIEQVPLSEIAPTSASTETPEESDTKLKYMDKALNVTVNTSAMVMSYGQPAFIYIGQKMPDLVCTTTMKGRIGAKVIKRDPFVGGEVIYSVPERNIEAGESGVLPIPLMVRDEAHYELQAEFKADGYYSSYDSIHFFGKPRGKAKKYPNSSEIAYLDDNDKMLYVPDFKGNRILDFSNAGYMGGGKPIPNLPARVVVSPVNGDDTDNIQNAINAVQALEPDENGFRGAVLLQPGVYDVGGQIKISKSGVVLRGSGRDENGTVIIATGVDTRDLVSIGGTGSFKEVQGTKRIILNEYVPSGAKTFRVDSAEGYAVGDNVLVARNSNRDWILFVGGERSVYEVKWEPWTAMFDRMITKIEGNEITLDAPISNAIESKWGGGYLAKNDRSGSIQNSGIENMQLLSAFSTIGKPALKDSVTGLWYYPDEEHSWRGISMVNAQNCWVRDITLKHFSHMVQTGSSTKWITVQDCSASDSVAEYTGSRKYFYYDFGQLNLHVRCYAKGARHAYVINSYAPFTSVFLDCVSEYDNTRSEPHHKWSTGGLFDNVTAKLGVGDRFRNGSGHGWAGANYVVWNSKGDLVIHQPPGAQNYAIGHVGTLTAQYQSAAAAPQGYVDSFQKPVAPVSLYKQQLKERLGEQALEYVEYKKVDYESIPKDLIDISVTDVPPTVTVTKPDSSPQPEQYQDEDDDDYYDED